MVNLPLSLDPLDGEQRDFHLLRLSVLRSLITSGVGVAVWDTTQRENGEEQVTLHWTVPASEWERAWREHDDR